MTEQHRTRTARRRDVVAAWVLWVLANLLCVAVGVGQVQEASAAVRADASVVGTFVEPDSGCPGEVDYAVDGTTYRVDVGGRGWCGSEGGDDTSPQRVFYDSDDPEVAVFADPGGTTATIVLCVVAVVLLLGFLGWLQWFWWVRQRPWWSQGR